MDEIYKDLMKDRLFEWLQTASESDQLLFEKVSNFEHLFADMIFVEGTSTHNLIACQSKNIDSDVWIEDEAPLPDELDYFSYSYFTYHVEELGAASGRFCPAQFSFSVSPESLSEDFVILHEMIHLHEFVIDGLPLFYHDAVIWCLYKDLQSKIQDLDNRIEAHGHILNSQLIAHAGGAHDILFLLKSFDLDLKMGYPLGTVFGYGMTES